MGTAMERKPTPALQVLAPGRLLLGEQLLTKKGSQGVAKQGELQGWLQSHLQQPLKKDPKGLYFTVGSKLSNSIFPRDWISSSSTFSGGPVTRSKRTHQWMSGVTMLVRWLCSFPASALLAQVGPFVLPRPQEMHPSATGAREPTGGVLSKVGQ